MEAGNFPQVHSKTDFETCSMSSLLTSDSVEIDAKKEYAPWSKNEQTLLIQSIYEHGDNWDEIV